MPSINRPNLRVMRNTKRPSTMFGRPDMKCGPFSLYRRPANSNDGWEYFVRIERKDRPVRVVGPSSSEVAHARYVKLIQTRDKSVAA